MQSLYRWKYLAFYNFALGVVMSLPRFTIRKDLQDYGVDIAEVYIALVPLSIPWVLKSIPGFCFDKYTLCGYNRKSYLTLACALNAVVSILFLIPGLNFAAYLTLCVLYQQTLVFWDVIIDSIMIEDSHKAEKEKARGALFVLTVILRGLGAAVGDSCGAIAWGDVGSRGVFLSCFGILALNTIVGFFVPDIKFRALFSRVASAGVQVSNLDDVRNNDDEDVMILQQGVVGNQKVLSLGWRYQIAEIRISLSHHVLRRLLIFNMASLMIPSPGLIFFYFLNDEVQFTTEDMSILTVVSQSIQLILVILYVWKLKFYGIRFLYTVTAVLSLAAAILPLFLVIQVPVSSQQQYCGYGHTSNGTMGLLTEFNRTFTPKWNNDTSEFYCYYFQYYAINPMFLALSDDVLGEIVDILRNMPMTMVLIAVCGKNVEASVFSSVLGLLNMMGLAKRVLDYFYTKQCGIKRGNYNNFGPFLLFCAVVELFVSLCIVLIPNESVPKVEAEAADNLRKISQRRNNAGAISEECREIARDIIEKELRSFDRRQTNNTATEVIDSFVLGRGLVGRKYSTSDSQAVV